MAVLGRGPGPLGAKGAPEQDAAVLAAPGSPQQGIADDVHHGPVEYEIHPLEVRHTEPAGVGGRAVLDLVGGLGFSPLQHPADVLPALAEVAQGPPSPDLERLGRGTGLQGLRGPTARVDAEVAA